MTRFVYIADSHIGAEEQGYHQQIRYAEYLAELLRYLDVWIQDQNIDFVLHGGDVVDHVSMHSIQTARTWLNLSVPVYVCLGNHDLTHPEAAEMWLKEASDFFPGGSLEFSITLDGTIIFVMPNHWCETPYYWDLKEQSPHFKQDQMRKWEEMTTFAADRNVILCTHNEVAAVPISQTGFAEAYHIPSSHFVKTVMTLIHQYPNMRCILSGHNHINTCQTLNKTAVGAVTVSAFAEVPFEFKVIDVNPGQITMRTESLIRLCDFKTDYNYNKTFVQGRLKDRAFDLMW